MSQATVTLSTSGQIEIPQSIRDELHWEAGTRLTLVAGTDCVTLHGALPRTGHRFVELIGMLGRGGPTLATEDLVRPVDDVPDWDAAERRDR